MTDAQFACQAESCEFCEDKPCMRTCPVNCSPADFIMAARGMTKVDFQRAAAEIMLLNPLGGVCGMICPDTHCQAKCSHRTFDGHPIEIPKMQSYIIQKAKDLGVMPKLAKAEKRGKSVGIVGSGPAGLGTAITLAQRGFDVTIYERHEELGGALLLIPEERLLRSVLETDIAWALDAAGIEVVADCEVATPNELLKKHDAVCIATGLYNPMKLGIPGEEHAQYGNAFLAKKDEAVSGRVLVVGGGAIAVDCALTALTRGACCVELLALEKLSELPLTPAEKKHIEDAGIEVSGRTRLKEILVHDGKIVGVKTQRVELNGSIFNLREISDVKDAECQRNDVKNVIIAIGNRPEQAIVDMKGVFYAGDGYGGASTAVEAVANGKNIAVAIEDYITKGEMHIPAHTHPAKSSVIIDGYNNTPVCLETDFFGRKLPNPFLLSAAPPSDGFEQMKKALEAGWAGGFMKTAFDNLDIHIPAGYMFVHDAQTYSNCDNVSEHPLNRVCSEIKELVKLFPDRLIAASTGGPVSGHDEADRAVWQSNTRKLEAAGAMAVEYSLSCPQGGDGTEGDIVSQNAALTAKIIDWVMEVSDPAVPKLFKLTAAVTSVAVILKSVREVLDRYPNKPAGVTLANTFPALTFRDHMEAGDHLWDEGVLVGLSGHGVTPISNLTLYSVAKSGVAVSGNGGPMNYRDAANFLALGAKNVQFCTIAMKHGLGIIKHLTEGLSHFMADRGIKSVDELIGRGQNSVTDFMDLTPNKGIPQVDESLCVNCGNCARCSYFGITFDPIKKIPIMHAENCVGCTICTKKCMSGALSMRARTPEEVAAYPNPLEGWK